MPARSTRWRPACCRSRWARRPRPCLTPSTAPSTTASPCAGAPRPTPTTPRAQSSATRDVRRAREADRGAAAAASPARSCRRRRHSPPSRSTATAPTTWRARARRWSWRRARSQIESLTLRRHARTPTRPCFEARCGKGTYVRALARDMGRALGCLGHLIALRRTRVAPFDEAEAVTSRPCEAAAEKAARRRCTAAAASHRGRPAGPRRAQRRPERRRAPAARAGGADPRPRCSDGDRPDLCNLQGPPDRRRQIEKGELHPIRVFNFGSTG